MYRAIAGMIWLLCAGLPVWGAEEGWVELFDGKTLDGWETHSGSAKFEVDQGTILGSTVPRTPNSFLCTKKKYEDFILEFDVLLDRGLNSGVQIRSQVAKGETVFWFLDKNGKPKKLTLPDDRVYGYQVEIADADSKRSGGLYDEARRFFFLDELTDRPEAQSAFKDGEWNHFRVECKGQRIRTWVNDVPCADVQDGLTPRGFIGLQVHGQVSLVGRLIFPDEEYVLHQVRWKNIRIKELK